MLAMDLQPGLAGIDVPTTVWLSEERNIAAMRPKMRKRICR